MSRDRIFDSGLTTLVDDNHNSWKHGLLGASQHPCMVYRRRQNIMELEANRIKKLVMTSCIVYTELGTLEWDTFNPDCLIRISNVDTFNGFKGSIVSRAFAFLSGGSL